MYRLDKITGRRQECLSISMNKGIEVLPLHLNFSYL